MKKLSVILAIAASGIVAIVFLTSSKESAPTTTAIKIAASFYPLAEFLNHVGAEKVAVINIVPPGVEPHDFEPTPQDITKVYSAKIFIFNGSGFDQWAEKITPELEKRGVTVLRMTDYFELRAGVNESAQEEKLDPHIWLDPLSAKKEVEIIRDTLKKIDPDNGEVYALNAKKYLAKLSELDRKYAEGLAACPMRDIVVSHAAFGYLAKRYNLNIFSIAGLSPEEEPSPKKLAEIAKFAQEKNIKYIFFETLVSPKLAETIAREIGAETLVFNPLEGLAEEELTIGKNYISVMEENLTNLRQALACT